MRFLLIRPCSTFLQLEVQSYLVRLRRYEGSANDLEQQVQGHFYNVFEIPPLCLVHGLSIISII